VNRISTVYFAVNDRLTPQMHSSDGKENLEKKINLDNCPKFYVVIKTRKISSGVVRDAVHGVQSFLFLKTPSYKCSTALRTGILCGTRNVTQTG
jgi:hypothetical protein